MSKWFVFCDATYYPYAETVEAETAEAAGRAVAESDYEHHGVVVFPFEAVAHRNFEPGGSE